MIIHEKVTIEKAEELGYLDNYLTAVIEGHDITEYNSGSILSYWVITEFAGDSFTIKVMNVDEATEYMRNIIQG